MAAFGEVKVIHFTDVSSPVLLKEMILNQLKEPVIFKGYLNNSWKEPLKWSPQVLAGKLSEIVTSFKICPKEGTEQYKRLSTNNDNGVIYETDCQYINATFKQFSEWLEQKHKSDKKQEDSGSNYSELERPSKRAHLDDNSMDNSCNPFTDIHHTDYWVYADYKYMSQLCPSHHDIISSIDWSLFGFPSLNGTHSTIWIGSEGSCTPCHYDTYGCNLVAQLWGSKEWILYHPNDSLYPTRVPYEESSVFSSVNVKSPLTGVYTDFLNAKPYKVILYPGDVLYVPHHWWHYVECIEPAVSVNTWIDMPQDKEERVKEALARLMVSNFVTKDNEQYFLNPNETIFPTEDNLALLNSLLRDGDHYKSVSLSDVINVLTSEQVLSLVKEKLHKRL